MIPRGQKQGGWVTWLVGIVYSRWFGRKTLTLRPKPSIACSHRRLRRRCSLHFRRFFAFYGQYIFVRYSLALSELRVKMALRLDARHLLSCHEQNSAIL